MLGSISIFSAKGMVAVPNLSGLNTAGIQQALTSSGLKYQNSGSISTQNSNINGLLASQSVTSGTLVDYETTISFETYTYVATTTPTPTPTPTGGVTTHVYFAYCSGLNQVTSGASIIDGTDVTSGCTTLRSQQGNPTGWVCGTDPNPSPSVNCSTAPPTPEPTAPPVTYNCRVWLLGSSQVSGNYYYSSTNDDNQGNLPCNSASILCVESPSIPGTGVQSPYSCTPPPTTPEPPPPSTDAPATCTPSCGSYSVCTGIYRYRSCTAADCSVYSEYAGC